MAKLVLPVLIVVVLGGAFFGVQALTQKKASPPLVTADIFPQTSIKPFPTLVPTPKTDLSDPKDITDTALDRDFQQIQTNLNKLDANQKTVSTDTSSTDTPPAD